MNSIYPMESVPVIVGAPPAVDTGYAYLRWNRRRTVACTLPELAYICGTGDLPPLVRTPETDGMVPPWQVPALRPAIAARIRNTRARLLGVVMFALVFATGFSDDVPFMGAVIAFIFGGIGWMLWTPGYSGLTQAEARAAREAALAPPVPVEGKPGPRTWRDLVPPGPKPATGEYGMLARKSGALVPASREELLQAARTRTPPLLVWTPDSDTVVPIWEVPLLVDAMSWAPIPERVSPHTRGALWILAVLIMVGVGVMDAGWGRFVAVLLASIALLQLLLAGIARLQRVRPAPARLRPEDLREQADALAEATYRQSLPAPWTTAISRALIATGLLQLVYIPPTIAAGALNMPDVVGGEWWRLFTAPMLHGGGLHWLFNWGALLSLGRDMETRGPRGWVPITFLAAALAGGAGSLLAPPHGNSVGASGGLMGMFGFLAVMAYRRREEFAAGFQQALLKNIGLIAVVGLMWHQFIDNGAHAGGLLAGLILALFAVPSVARRPAWTGGPALERAGQIALGVIIASAAAAFITTIAGVLRG